MLVVVIYQGLFDRKVVKPDGTVEKLSIGKTLKKVRFLRPFVKCFEKITRMFCDLTMSATIVPDRVKERISMLEAYNVGQKYDILKELKQVEVHSGEIAMEVCGKARDFVNDKVEELKGKYQEAFEHKWKEMEGGGRLGISFCWRKRVMKRGWRRWLS